MLRGNLSQRLERAAAPPGCASIAARLMRPFRAEAGFALAELLVVLALLIVIVTALAGLMAASQRSQVRSFNYATTGQQTSAGLESMVAQIRQATLILASGSNFVEMNVTLQGTPLLVQYECDVAQPGTSYRECVRVQAPAGGTLPAISSGVVVVPNLQNGTSTNPVFSWGPDPNAPYYLTATVEVPASGGNNIGFQHSMVFSDGALMRNLNVGN